MGLLSGVMKRGAQGSEGGLIFNYEHIDLKGQNIESVRAMITEQAPPTLECLRDRLLENSG